MNVAAIAPELFESELFGHVRGSFTGAVAERKGYFEQADHGTLFLDEIGELRLEHQGKLLRVLQERTFHRVGATRPTTVDVRIVAASNRDLGRGVAEGWFREDLYFRLRGLVLRLPPLRERRGDVAPLAERFMEEAAAEHGRRVALVGGGGAGPSSAMTGRATSASCSTACARRPRCPSARSSYPRICGWSRRPAPAGSRATATRPCWTACAATASTCRRRPGRWGGTGAR